MGHSLPLWLMIEGDIVDAWAACLFLKQDQSDKGISAFAVVIGDSSRYFHAHDINAEGLDRSHRLIRQPARFCA